MTQKQLLETATPILQGLLSTGQYTDGGQELSEHRIKTVDNGEDWKKTEFSIRRYSSAAVLDAIELAVELIRQVEREVEIENSDSLNGAELCEMLKRVTVHKPQSTPKPPQHYTDAVATDGCKATVEVIKP